MVQEEFEVVVIAGRFLHTGEHHAAGEAREEVFGVGGQEGFAIGYVLLPCVDDVEEVLVSVDHGVVDVILAHLGELGGVTVSLRVHARQEQVGTGGGVTGCYLQEGRVGGGR